MKKNQQSLSRTQVNILKGVVVLIIVMVVIFLIRSWVGQQRKTPSQITTRPPTSSFLLPERLQPGKIGEPKEEEKPQAELPLVISNTTGTIKEIKEDRVIILGDGSNFADQKPRELTLIFTETTITFGPGQKVKYVGLEGLKYLKVGEEIRISSSENIRGKTEFLVNYINKF
jgi:hypothetical protein